MFAHIVDFADLLLAALLVGTMFGIWLGFNPMTLPASAFVAQQQQAIRGLNVRMPILGGVTVLLTALAAVLSRADPARLVLLAAAAVCLATAGIITRTRNQPINAIVMTWSADAPPPAWTQLRDKWWRWHVVRTGAGIAGLALMILATIARNSSV